MIDIEAKQPNSARRKCVRVQLCKHKQKKLVYVPFCGGRTFLKIHDTVTIQSIGGSSGRAKGDLYGLNYKVIKVNGTCLKQKFLRKK
jgi:small subunit ribosomal protein S12